MAGWGEPYPTHRQHLAWMEWLAKQKIITLTRPLSLKTRTVQAQNRWFALAMMSPSPMPITVKNPDGTVKALVGLDGISRDQGNRRPNPEGY